MMLLKLALRNLLGGGLKTWLRVIVLSLAFVAIIALQGMINGMNQQASRAMIAADIGGGQYWQRDYDPQNPLTFPDAHAVVPAELGGLVASGRAAPILAVPGFMYVSGGFRSVLLKGIDPAQHVLSLPTAVLADAKGELPALIGTRMAREAGLKAGDSATIRWRDSHGTFDAQDVRIAQIMNTIVPSVDNAQLWLPLAALQRMARMDREATWVVVDAQVPAQPKIGGWEFKNPGFLLSDLRATVRAKTVGNSIFYLILLFLAMLAILDTQILSIFHRRREIGTLIALGLTRGAVIGMFTIEGALNAILATLAGACYAIPLLGWFEHVGMPVPSSVDAYGLALGERLYPAYGAALVAGTTALVLVVTAVVSYLPTREIARLKPTDALRGRLA
jgi:ABC-type lipoprotein release transport system permease subunit